MALNSKVLLHDIDRRDLLKVSLLAAAATMVDFDAYGATNTNINLLIGRPTDKSVALSLLSRDRKSTRLNSSHVSESRMPSSA